MTFVGFFLILTEFYQFYLWREWSRSHTWRERGEASDRSSCQSDPETCPQLTYLVYRIFQLKYLFNWNIFKLDHDIFPGRLCSSSHKPDRPVLLSIEQTLGMRDFHNDYNRSEGVKTDLKHYFWLLNQYLMTLVDPHKLQSKFLSTFPNINFFILKFIDIGGD